MRRSTRNPWAFRIDYPREIAADEAEISQLTEPGYVAACRLVTDEEAPHLRQLHALEWVAFGWSKELRSAVEIELRAGLLGLTVAELADYGRFAEWETLPAEVERQGVYRRGEAVAKRFDGLVLRSEPERVGALKHARAALARHKRNAAKYGT